MVLAIGKVFVAAILISFVSWLSGKKIALAGFLTAIPLTTLIALAFSQLEWKDSTQSVEYAKSDLDMAKGYSYGSLVFDENISKTNNAGYVFGMKLSSREADFGAFGFNEFISQMDTITPGSSTNDGGTKILSTQPEDLNHPESRSNFETSPFSKSL